MLVMVTGSRGWTARDKLDAALDYLYDLTYFNGYTMTLIHGGAKGADTMAQEWAKNNRVQTQILLPDWNKYGRRAGIVRNNQMLDNSPSLVLAFWDGTSRGTQHAIHEAQRRGIPTKVVTNDDST